MKKLVIYFYYLIIPIISYGQSPFDGIFFYDHLDIHCGRPRMKSRNVIDNANIVAQYRFEFDRSIKKKYRAWSMAELQIGETYHKFYDLNKYSLSSKSNKQKFNSRNGVTPYFVASQFYTDIYKSIADSVMTVAAGAVLTDTAMFIYKDIIPKFQWELLDGKFEVLGYDCKKAKVTYAGLEWIVLYTNEIKTNAGPWKLGGLGGLILKAEDTNGRFLFECVSIANHSSLKPKIEYFTYYLTKEITKNGFLDYLIDCYEYPYKVASGGNDDFLVVLTKRDGSDGIHLKDNWRIPYLPLER